MAFSVYGIIWIFDSSFVYQGDRTFCLSDDMMVSMRYAKHLAAGEGLVFNAGEERVEGYSNPLWVMVMGLFHFLPLAPSKMSLLVQLSGLLLLCCNIVVIRRIFQILLPEESWLGNMVAFLVAFCYPLNMWGFSGFEVSALALLLSLSIYGSMTESGGYRFSTLPALLMGFSTLIRLDMVVPCLCMLIFSYLMNKGDKKVFQSAAILAGFLALQFGVRYLYYGEILPNTYYLKMTGYPLLLRISRGLWAYLRILFPLNWIFFLLSLLIFFRKGNPILRLLSLLIFSTVAYSIWVGGDAWEWWGIPNRFLTPVIPFVIGISIYSIYMGIIRRFVFLKSPLFLTILAGLMVFLFNISFSKITPLGWITLNHPFNEKKETQLKLEVADHFKSISTPEAKIAVIWAGTIPYFCERSFIDLLGKNDPVIAKGSMHRYEELKDAFPHNNFLKSPFTFFYPGHLKWNYPYSVGELKPDIIFLLWGDATPVMSLLKTQYRQVSFKGYPVFIRRNSPHINFPPK